MPKCVFCGMFTVVDSLMDDHLCSDHDYCEGNDE